MEGHLTMSKKERARLVMMAKVMKSEMKISEPYDGCEASELLGLSYRQTFRIAKRYGGNGSPVLDCPSARTRVTPLEKIYDISKEL